ncbi:MAG: hypothetical protein AB1632_14065 [Nitrospirota bacterium]
MLISCAGSKYLIPKTVDDTGGTSGLFTVILYNSGRYDGLETIAILDMEGDSYKFIPYAPEFDYRMIRGMGAADAVEISAGFVSSHPSFHKQQIREIQDRSGRTTGYEIRPLYLPFVYGKGDVLEVGYRIEEGGVVKVTIRLDPSIEKSFIDFRDNN